MTPEPVLSLALSVSAVNTVLMALNEAPYRVSAPIIATIMEQANAERTSSDAPATSPDFATPRLASTCQSALPNTSPNPGS